MKPKKNETQYFSPQHLTRVTRKNLVVLLNPVSFGKFEQLDFGRAAFPRSVNFVVGQRGVQSHMSRPTLSARPFALRSQMTTCAGNPPVEESGQSQRGAVNITGHCLKSVAHIAAIF